MKKYIERLQNEKTPHERRRFAMQFAGVITAFVFVAWASTLGIRLSGQTSTPTNQQNTAATLEAVGASSTLVLPDQGGY